MRLALVLGLVGVGIGIWFVLSGKSEASVLGPIHEVGTAGGFGDDPVVFTDPDVGTRFASGIEVLPGF